MAKKTILETVELQPELDEATQPELDEATQPPVVLVRMLRDNKTADVHPLEVSNFAAGGWEIID